MKIVDALLSDILFSLYLFYVRQKLTLLFGDKFFGEKEEVMVLNTSTYTNSFYFI